MGLDLSYAEYIDAGDDDSAMVKPAVLGCCKYTSDSWWELCDKQRDGICAACPAECEHTSDNDSFGCYPRAGSYSYVALLATYMREFHPEVEGNYFVESTTGGGYHPAIANQKYILRDLRKIREFLTDKTIQGIVGYKDGVRDEEHFWSASPAINSIGLPDWFAASSGVCIGVHFNKGITTFTGSSVTCDGFVYAAESRAPVVLRLVKADWTLDEPSYDVVRFEEVPALRQFGHLLDTFERILVKAIELDLTVVGC